MDVVLQIFKRSICQGTPFFESLAKKPPTKMDDLFRQANKYSMLEDDVRTATQQVLVSGRPSRGEAERNAKPPNRPRPWPRPQGTDPSTRDHSKRCAFHKEHGHTTETCRSLQYLVEKLIKAGHLKQYLRSDTKGKVTSQHHNPGAPRAPAAPKAIINYINGGPSDEEYDSRRKRQKLLRVASICERINSIRPGLTGGGPCPIDGTIIFPPVDPTRTLQPHRDALILSLEIGDFDMRHILVDPGSSTDLVQASVVAHMGHSLAGLENPRQILSEFSGSSPHPWETSYCRSKLAQSLSTYNSRWLNVFSTAKPVRQKIRRFHPDRQKIIRNEIDKLLEAGFIREVDYPDWLANVVVVPKKEGKWRVCVDYTNLNNACPKDSFPLPRIDQIVDSIAGQGMLSFLDAFSGYHQIPLSPADEEKTAFLTPYGLYCYKVMPFGLKNAGTTYQRLMTKIFKPLIGHTVEVYIDDVVVKPKRDRGEPGPSQGSHGNTSPRSKKELQRFTGKLIALGRFIARFTDELRPFFLAIRKTGANGWTNNCQNAMGNQRCSIPLPLTKEQKSIYYVSRALADVETRYLKMELTALALRSAVQKLRPYFQAHPVVVLTDQPLRNILHKPRFNQKNAAESNEKEWWTLRVDGASRSSGSGVGLLLQSPTGEHLEQAIRLGFPASNNEAEYEAILSGLDLALALSVSKLRVYSDSQLVVRHI
ncbi:Transposon Ty3-I Gag-Pol polyprotein [Vitis vinifera]|uniref:Transposon Ty3-I Gag-Pol polyprotein n=1 Tax=Vitis vinifera TaxID=29760 RepID=A0A438FQG6_VITVI|nr:Transposon Ty3-I Gag-Pol polyprotein [Vitis vinifera]